MFNYVMYLPEGTSYVYCSMLHRTKEKAHDFSRGMNPTTHDTNHER